MPIEPFPANDEVVWRVNDDQPFVGDRSVLDRQIGFYTKFDGLRDRAVEAPNQLGFETRELFVPKSLYQLLAKIFTDKKVAIRSRIGQGIRGCQRASIK